MKNQINLPGFTGDDSVINRVIPSMRNSLSGIDTILCIKGCQNEYSNCMAVWGDIGFSNIWTQNYCQQQASECSARCQNAGFGWGSLA